MAEMPHHSQPHQPDTHLTSSNTQDEFEPKPDLEASSIDWSASAPGHQLAIATTMVHHSCRKRLWISSMMVHILAVASTIAIVQLSFRQVYWFDENTTAVDFLWFDVDSQTNRKALQFGAKLHETLIWALLSAMVIHFMRRMLIGQGVSFGLIDGAYQFGSIPWLFSGGLWGTFLNPGRPGNFLFALSLALLVIYANLVGPSAAIALIPTLDWWRHPGPFRGDVFETYLTGTDDEIYPSFLDRESDDTYCLDNRDFRCPGYGNGDLRNLLGAHILVGAELETLIKTPIAENYRVLNATLEFSSKGKAIAVATTLHSSTPILVGTLWHYIQNHDVGDINQVKRPKFQPAQNHLAPLVQVQCSRFSQLRAQAGTVNPRFESGAMRNFSALLSQTPEADLYQRNRTWDLPREYWDVDQEDLSMTTFQWLDIAEWYSDAQLSLGALATVPVKNQTTHENGTVTLSQDRYIVPCMVDDRFEAGPAGRPGLRP